MIVESHNHSCLNALQKWEESLIPQEDLNNKTSKNDSLQSALELHATTPQELCKRSRLESSAFVTTDHHLLFTRFEIQLISKIAIHILSKKNSDECVYVPRKDSGLSVKLVFPNEPDVFLLLPHKSCQPHIGGGTKIGRIALKLSLMNETWTAKPLFSLNSVSSDKFQSRFLDSAENEMKLYEKFSQSIPACFYNYHQVSKKNKVKRSAYYELHTELFDFFCKKDSRNDINRIHRIALNAAMAIKDFHDHGFIVNDIKAENMLLKGNDVLLCDLDSILLEEFCGDPKITRTPEYMAHELINVEEQSNTTKPDYKKTDVFAFGSVLLFLAQGKFPSWTKDQIRCRLSEYSRPHFINLANTGQINLNSKIPISTICRLLSLAAWSFHPDPALRPDMAEICKHLNMSKCIDTYIYNPLLNEKW